MNGAKLTGDWKKAFKLLSEAPKRIDQALHEAVLQEAHRIRDQMVQGIDSGAPGGRKFAPHSPMTIVIRKFKGFGGNKIMIQSSTLRNSAVVIPIGRLAAFVGVRRRSSKGVDIARIQEFGKTFTVPFTKRMRAFFFAALRNSSASRLGARRSGSGGGMITIRIPARPYVRPIVDRLDLNAIRQRFADAVARALR